MSHNLNEYISNKSITELWKSSTASNTITLWDYYDRLREICLNMFEWVNLPDYMDERFLERTLFDKGFILFFKETKLIEDVEVEAYFSLPCTFTGGFTVYEIPINRQAYSVNGYFGNYSNEDSVIIWNNRNHKPTRPTIAMYANRLANVERTLDVNIKMLKNPLIANIDEKQKLSMANLFDKYDGNEPYIMTNKDNFNVTDLKTNLFPVNTPNNVQDLLEYKHSLYNECMTFLGLSNINRDKRERMITDEVNAQNEQLLQQRFNMLDERRRACEQINKMFGLNIWCNFRVSANNDVSNGDSDNDGNNTNLTDRVNNQQLTPRGEIYGYLYN